MSPLEKALVLAVAGTVLATSASPKPRGTSAVVHRRRQRIVWA